ncbi:CBS domain-containing protein [Aureimonas psammosilenae]|uniref:CBS domain-containing protein n=1 Tax=Aureimonas psammosilenae TaxID=2495496 RepID=UPI0012604FB0|nr:CBS domain-containing protein [Aureimonas psammosilenae]
MNVASILSEKGSDVFTMRPDASLATAASELSTRRIGAVVLVDEAGRIAGILSERDIVRVVGSRGEAGLSERVADVMTKNVSTCSESTSIDELMSLMTRGRFRHVPVVEAGRLVGLVSIGDVVKRRIAEAVQEAEHMRSYIAEAG